MIRVSLDREQVRQAAGVAAPAGAGGEVVAGSRLAGGVFVEVPAVVRVLSEYAGCLPDCPTHQDAEENACICGYHDAWNAVFYRPTSGGEAVGEMADLPALTSLANLIRRCAHGALRSRGVEDAERLGGAIAIRVGMSGKLLDAMRETLADADGPALTPPAGEVGKVLAWLDRLSEIDEYKRADWDGGPRPMRAAATVRALVAQAREAEGLRERSAEMISALCGIGVFRSDEAGDDGSEWCVTLDPRGEEPVGSLPDALTRVMEAAEGDGRRVGEQAGQAREAALRARVADLEGAVGRAHNTLERNASSLERVASYAVKHGPDVSVTKAIAGVCEDLTMTAVMLANLRARAAETAGGGES